MATANIDKISKVTVTPGIGINSVTFCHRVDPTESVIFVEKYIDNAATITTFFILQVGSSDKINYEGGTDRILKV